MTNLQELIAIGRKLANATYNYAQGMTIADDQRDLLMQLVQDWDAKVIEVEREAEK